MICLTKEEVKMKDAIEYAKKNKTLLAQTSAKEDIGINDLFTLIAQKLYVKHMNGDLYSS